MYEEDYEHIEQLIGYPFDNRELLQQAFTRKSYTNETHDGDNNEILEFIGDKALDFVIVKTLSEHYGKVNRRGEFVCKLKEGRLTELKKRFVEGVMLAHCIENLGLNQYLIMGKGDKKNNAQDDTSVKEDLFEAILGAVAIDSNWDIDALQDVAELMLNVDYYLEYGFNDEDNYVMLVQQWYQKENGCLPRYEFQDTDEYRVNRMYHYFSIMGERDTIENEESSGSFTCKLYIDGGNPFVGFGNSKNKARMAAAEVAYEYLESEGMLYSIEDEIGEPSIERAISQLQELAQKGYCSMPEYEFEEKHDNDGNPYWRCDCSVKEYTYSYWAEASTKKEAKRKAAYDMLMSILHADGDDNDDDWED